MCIHCLLKREKKVTYKVSFIGRKRSFKRANYTANSPLHTPLKFAIENGWRNYNRTSGFVCEGEQSTSTITEAERSYAFLYPVTTSYYSVAAAALTRMTLNAAEYNKHSTTHR
jgi:hypothetical protein